MTMAIATGGVRPRVRPFRLAAGVLSLMLFFMLCTMLSIPTYEEELNAARAAYHAAAEENVRLRGELREAGRREAEAARDLYGYVQPGEIIYQPVFTDASGNPAAP